MPKRSETGIASAITQYTSTDAQGLGGMTLHRPVADVEIVNMLLDNVVAARPDEVIPVVKLEGQIAIRDTEETLQFVALPEPEVVRLIPVAAQGGNIADFPAMHVFHCFEVSELMAALRSSRDVET